MFVEWSEALDKVEEAEIRRCKRNTGCVEAVWGCGKLKVEKLI